MMSLRRRGFRVRSVALGIAAATSFALTSAHAQNASDQAAAEALFKQGRDLMTAGQFAEACPKFAESERLDPAPGTLLNLATCYEKAGQIASAWVTYKEAVTRARKADQMDRARMARDKAAELEPKLPTLTIVVPPGAERPGLVVRRDGQSVGRAEWGAAIPVDPGPHSVEASAPGFASWQAPTLSAAPGVHGSVELGALAKLPEARSESAAPPVQSIRPIESPPKPMATSQAGRGAGLTQAAWIFGGLGVAGLAAGGVLGAVALGDDASAKNNHCVASVCDAQGVSLTDDAKRLATGSTIAFAAGGAFLATGVVLFLISPRPGPEVAPTPASAARATPLRLSVLPFFGPEEATAVVRGSF